MASPESKQLSLAGIRVDALECEDLIEIVDKAKSSNDKLVILHHNLHSLYLYQKDPDFRATYQQASWVYIDGMPVVWMGEIAGLPLTTRNRTTLLDSFELFLAAAEQRGWRVFYLGSKDGIVERGLHTLRARFPLLQIAGRNGFFSRENYSDEQVISEINEFKPDLLFVGMGMPLQEKWAVQNRGKLSVSTIMTSGGTLNYVTGEAYKPPGWAGRLGLYGIMRLLHDPARLWRRYLVEPVFLLLCVSPRLLRQAAAARSHIGYRGQGVDAVLVDTDPASVAD